MDVHSQHGLTPSYYFGGEYLVYLRASSSEDKEEGGLSSLFILVPMCACGYACMPVRLCSYAGVVAVFGRYFPVS